MTEVARQRPQVDLDHLERELSFSAKHTPPKYDPLAELARIVGQDDPFRAILAGDYQDRDAKLGDGHPGDLRASRDDISDDRRHDGHDYVAELSADPGDREEDLQSYGTPQVEALRYQEPPSPAPRRKWLMAGAALGALVIGGGIWSFRGAPTGTNGEAPLVQAESGPLKVQPQNPGGIEIPDQNKQIYERGAPETQTKVVNREEQPLDVQQAARGVGASANKNASTPQGAAPILGEPRKVRTVSVRPDGTIVSADAGRDGAAAVPLPRPVMPTAPVVTSSSTPNPAGAGLLKKTDTKTETALAEPVAEPISRTPQPRPQKVQQRLTAAAPAQASIADPTETATIPPADVANPGAFSVQLAVRSSENDAKAYFKTLQAKYDSLEGLSPVVRKADVNGATVYRLRVGPLVKDEATSLCGKLKASGGQCFVAKN